MHSISPKSGLRTLRLIKRVFSPLRGLGFPWASFFYEYVGALPLGWWKNDLYALEQKIKNANAEKNKINRRKCSERG
jgi:hypothetical protein